MTARITIVGGTKGGSGKSTVSVNLAIMLALKGRDVLLIDADDQQTAKTFTDLRNEQREGGAGYTCICLDGKAVYTDTKRLAEKYDEIVIDCGGRDTVSQRAALGIGDIFLVPFVPRSFDVWTIEDVAKLVDLAKAANPSLEAMAFINRADPQGSDNDEAAAFIAQNPALTFIDTPIFYRKAYSNAAASGLSVVEQRPKNMKAIGEVTALYERIYSATVHTLNAKVA